jgi:anti-sigma28 factor (negative regulator of flagellin synthesis)
MKPSTGKPTPGGRPSGNAPVVSSRQATSAAVAPEEGAATEEEAAPMSREAEIDARKIEALKASIKKKKFQVDAKAIAKKILGD